MDLQFKFDPEVIIGADTLSMAGTVCRRLGKRTIIAMEHSLDSSLKDRLKEILQDSGVDAITYDSIEDDSGIEIADNIAKLSKASHCDSIIGFGNRKTQVIARVAANIASLQISSYDFLDGKIDLSNLYLKIKFVSIPTKGLDAFSFTDYFLVQDPRTRLIKQVKSLAGINSGVIIDSSLYTFLKSVTGAAFIFEGFSSAVEAYCSSKANNLSDPILEKALSIYAKMFKGGPNLTADNYAQVCFLTALGASISSPGAGDALACALSTRFSVTKQNCWAALLLQIAEKLIAARPEKIARIAVFLGAKKLETTAATAQTAVSVIQNCMEPMGLQTTLKEYNIAIDKAIPAAEAARNLDFVSNSPWIVSEEEIFNILKQIGIV